MKKETTENEVADKPLWSADSPKRAEDVRIGFVRESFIERIEHLQTQYKSNSNDARATACV